MLLKPGKQQKLSGLFFEEFRRAVSPFRFLLLLIVSAAILTFGFRGLAQRVPFERSFLDNWFGTFADSYYFQLIPLIAAFPFADSFVIDKKQGFLFQVLSRATYGSYARIKTVVNALTGGIAAVFPLMILYFLTSVFTKAPLNHPEIDAASLRPTSPFLYDLYSTQPDLFILLLLMVVFIFGASLATLGLSVSCAINNRFVALGAPLFLYNGLEFFATRTRLIPNLFIPSRALFLPMNENQSIHSAAGCLTVFVLPGLFLLISFTIFAIFGKRSNAMNDDRKPFALSPILPADGGISWIPRGHLLRRMIIRAKCTFRMNIVLIVALAIAGSGLFYTRYLATNGNLFGEMGVIP